MFPDLQLNPDQPLQKQLYFFLSQQILHGRMPPDMRLPSTRRLASNLTISRNTVNAVYQQLSAEGFIRSQAGSGWFICAERPDERIDSESRGGVTSNVSEHQSELVNRLGDAFHFDGDGHRPFTPGLPDLDEFPLKLWNRLIHQHESRTRLMGYGDFRGLPELRQQIAIYLRESRGVVCQPEQILITQGAQQALNIAVQLLINPGDVVIMENPGYRRMQAALRLLGANIQPIAVDDQGLQIDHLSSWTEARMLYCTPTHQYPLGGIMPISERLRLLQWARANGVWIIEDDYDSEFHFYRRPFPAMHSLLDEAPVIYLGSFSKTLYPALRIGYLVLPRPLIEPAVQIKDFSQGNSPQLQQAVLAQFIEEGHFRRHLRRMCLLYQRKWEYFMTRWQQTGNTVLQPVAHSAGMHVVLRGNIDEQAASTLLMQHGFGCAKLSGYYISPPIQTGLVLGYANASETDIERLIELLEEFTR